MENYKSTSKFLDIKYPGWDVGKCLTTLLNNAHENSTHKCAQYVRKAIQAGGISTSGNPIKAQEYHTKGFLKDINFKLVDILENQNDILNYRALPGDIAVMYAPTGDTGHICMWTGAEWVSDFIQSSIRPYKSTGNNPSTIWIWRWNGYKWLEENDKSV